MVRGLGNCCCPRPADPDCNEPEVFNYPFATSLNGGILEYTTPELVQSQEAWWVGARAYEYMDSRSVSLAGADGNFEWVHNPDDFFQGSTRPMILGKPINCNLFEDKTFLIKYRSSISPGGWADFSEERDQIGVELPWFGWDFSKTLYPVGNKLFFAHRRSLYGGAEFFLPRYTVSWFGPEGWPDSDRAFGLSCGLEIEVEISLTPSTEPPTSVPYRRTYRGVDTCAVAKKFYLVLSIDGSTVFDSNIWFYYNIGDGGPTQGEVFRYTSYSVEGRAAIGVGASPVTGSAGQPARVAINFQSISVS